MKNLTLIGVLAIFQVSSALASSKTLDQFDGTYQAAPESQLLSYKAIGNSQEMSHFKVNLDLMRYDYLEIDELENAEINRSYPLIKWELSENFFPFFKEGGLMDLEQATFRYVSRYPIGPLITTELKNLDTPISLFGPLPTSALSLPGLDISDVFKCSILIETGEKKAQFQELRGEVIVKVAETLNLKFIKSDGSLNNRCLVNVLNQFREALRGGILIKELSGFSPFHDMIIGTVLTNFPKILGSYESGTTIKNLDSRNDALLTHFELSRELKWYKID